MPGLTAKYIVSERLELAWFRPMLCGSDLDARHLAHGGDERNGATGIE